MNDSGRVLVVTDAGELERITPQCQTCIFYERLTFTCAAFPNGIPASIQLNLYDHRKLYPLQKGPCTGWGTPTSSTHSTRAKGRCPLPAKRPWLSYRYPRREPRSTYR